MRILLLAVGNAPTRELAVSIIHDNFVDRHTGGHEILTFGYNGDVDIPIAVDDEFEAVVARLPAGWTPDLCILPWIDRYMLPRGIERAPFHTVAMPAPGDWDDDVAYTRAIAQAVDLCGAGGAFDLQALTAIGAKRVELFYPSSVADEFIAVKPVPIAARQVDILYTTRWINDVSHADRSRWLRRVAALGGKYRVRLVRHFDSYRDYTAALGDAKLVFSHVRTNMFSGRVLEAAGQGAVPVVTGSDVLDHFEHGEEIVHVDEARFEQEIARFLANPRKLQAMSDRVHRKTQQHFESRRRFIRLVDFLRDKLQNTPVDVTSRAANRLSAYERQLRSGEANFSAFFGPVCNASFFDPKRLEQNAARLMRTSVEAFERAIALDPTPRAKCGLAVTRAAFALWYNRRQPGGPHQSEAQRCVSILGRVTADHPRYAMAWLNLGVLHYARNDVEQSLEALRRALELFADESSEVDPWCLQLRDREIWARMVQTPLNATLLRLSRGETTLAMRQLRDLYQSVILYFVGLAEGRKGRVPAAIDALLRSHRLRPEQGIVSAEAAKTLALMGDHEQSLALYRHTLDLWPLDLTLRIDLIRLLYHYGRGREATDIVKDVLQVVRTIPLFRSDAVRLKEVLSQQTRRGSAESHDLAREALASDWLGTLYRLLVDGNDWSVAERLLEMLAEQDRCEPALEILEHFASTVGERTAHDTAPACAKTLYQLGFAWKERWEQQQALNRVRLRRLRSLCLAPAGCNAAQQETN